MEMRVANGDSSDNKLAFRIVLVVCGFLATGYAVWLGATTLSNSTEIVKVEQKLDDLIRMNYHNRDESLRAP